MELLLSVHVIPAEVSLHSSAACSSADANRESKGHNCQALRRLGACLASASNAFELPDDQTNWIRRMITEQRARRMEKIQPGKSRFFVIGC